MCITTKNTALILIDVQKAFTLDEQHWGGNKNNKNVEVICGKILETWRKTGLPIFHVRHSSTNPHSRLYHTDKGFEFHESVTPLKNEPVITKSVNSGFIGTNLKEQLDELNIKTVVIAGLTTNHCVSTTTRMAGNLGYETYVVSDGTASFDTVGIDGKVHSSEIIHSVALANLKNEFATIIDSKTLLNSIKKS